MCGCLPELGFFCAHHNECTCLHKEVDHDREFGCNMYVGSVGQLIDLSRPCTCVKFEAKGEVYSG